MIVWTTAAPSVLASFMASTVEVVEALTIVLAVGVVRGWRSALLGTATALAALFAMIVVLGPSLARIPLPVVQLVVGTLLLLFGLRWLRKAILRSAGVLALHDETEAFEKQTAALRAQGEGVRRSFDRLAFSTAFKIVMLEGIEVVFIVIAIGSTGHMILPAAIGALLALVIVVLAGFWLHKPLARVPENSLKFGVGVLLSAFGVFWVGEGIGLEWPGADLSILALAAAFLATALALVWASVRVPKRRPAPHAAANKPAAAKTPQRSGWLTAVGREVWGLFFDDGLLAIGAFTWIVLCAWIELAHLHNAASDAWVFVVGLLCVLGASTVKRARLR